MYPVTNNLKIHSEIAENTLARPIRLEIHISQGKTINLTSNDYWQKYVIYGATQKFPEYKRYISNILYIRNYIFFFNIFFYQNRIVKSRFIRKVDVIVKLYIAKNIIL